MEKSLILKISHRSLKNGEVGGKRIPKIAWIFFFYKSRTFSLCFCQKGIILMYIEQAGKKPLQAETQ